MKKLLSILLVVVLSMAAFVGCKDVSVETKITLSETQLTLAIGDQHALTATVENSEESVTWASSNANVVKVNKFGQLQVLALGTAEVTATIGKVSAKCVVTVNPVLTAEVSAITLVAPMEGLSADLTSKKISYTANPELAAGEELTYASSNDAVAVVEDVEVEEGVTEKRIVAKSIGAAVITATAPNGAKAEVAVTVEGLNENPTALTFEITTAVEVPEYCGVFLAGTLSTWGPMDGFELTRVDSKTFTGTFTFDFSEVGDTARNAEYKFILSSKADNGDGTYTYGGDTGWEQVNGDNMENRKMFVNKDETIKVDGVVFQTVPVNPALLGTPYTITINFTNPVGNDVYLIGDVNGWTHGDADYKFVASQDRKTFTLTCTYSTIETGVEVKINDGTWGWNYGSSDGIEWTQSGANYEIDLTGEVNETWNIAN